ncbi:MAG: 16S rRNA (uracil(1498)-N(3))-methyltransferase [Clostridia bacterium]|nr:16S rRNA (uracil(1498)-N(3))-methyltransferase [Clostridia bacterium]
MRKFFVDISQVNENKITICGDDVNHIKNVLRLDTNEKILVGVKNVEKNYICSISEILKKEIICDILEESKMLTESNVKIDIYQGLPKADKMELIIQKGTELGVNAFIPVNFKRTIVKFDEKDKLKKLDRWQKIAEVAAKQSGRNIIPKIKNIENIKNICNLIPEYDIVLVAYECEDKNSLKNELKKLNNKDRLNIAVVIGPEGGIEEQEVQTLQESGAKIVTLGKRILRTETVALAITAIINYELER